MNPAELFIKRPVATALIMVGILLFGWAGYRTLPVSDLPAVDFPTLTVSANLPGASAETMASSVATVLEKQFSTIAGIDSMNSTSAQGTTSITLQFALDRNIDAAAQDVQSAIAKAAGSLPLGMPAPPSYQKVNPADQPIMYMALGSSTLPMSTVTEYADTFIAQRVSMLPGVAQVGIFGSQKFAVRAQVDPDELAARGIGIDEVAAAIDGGNVNLPTGGLDGEYQSFIVRANGAMMNAAAFGPLVVAYRGGAPVRLSDVGQVLDSVESVRSRSWFGGADGSSRAIILAILRQPGTNTIQVVDSIKKMLPTLRDQLPAAVKFEVLFDRSETIRASVEDVKFTLLLTIALVILVIFVFLRNVSATIIPSLAVPLSIVGTFAVMSVMGYSLDNLSLMALTLSVGFVVDDAIVMLENIVRHMEAGETPYEASINGAREIGFTIISMTISLAAVFLPVMFLGGIIGRLFREFAVTISASILVSGFVSLSLTPMLCSRFLRGHASERRSWLYRATEKIFDAMLWVYAATLRVALRLSPLTLLVSLAMFAATVMLFQRIPKGFIPSEDTNQLFLMSETAQGTSFTSVAEKQEALNEIVRKDPNVLNFSSSAGAGGSSLTGNSGRIFMHLKDRPGRKPHVDQVIQEMRGKLAQVPGVRVFLQNPPTIRLGGYLTKALYQYTLMGPDTDDLYAKAPALEEKLRGLDILQDVTSDLQIRNPQIKVDIDRDKAATLGVTVRQIEEAMASAYSDRQVSTIYGASNQYRVILEVKPEFKADPETLPRLYVRSRTSGNLIPIEALAKITRVLGPQTINHWGQLTSVTLSFNLKPGVALGDAVAAVQSAARETLPATISGNFQGTAQAFQSSVKGLSMLLIFSILFIYLVLGILYESFVHPLTILSGLPSAGFGALLALMYMGIDLNIYAFVGIIMLIGIVKKNAIMMIDFALEAQRKQGMTAAEAIHAGCLARFRPIMMTTMAALVGTLPIALGVGAGAESRRPLGIAVVGGLAVSQMLTLYLTPVVYIYIDAAQRGVRRLVGGKPAAAVLPAAAPASVGGETL